MLNERFLKVVEVGKLLHLFTLFKQYSRTKGLSVKYTTKLENKASPRTPKYEQDGEKPLAVTIPTRQHLLGGNTAETAGPPLA